MRDVADAAAGAVGVELGQRVLAEGGLRGNARRPCLCRTVDTASSATVAMSQRAIARQRRACTVAASRCSRPPRAVVHRGSP